MKIQLHGYGKMGKMVEHLALEMGHSIVDQGDVCIDFSAAAGVIPNLKRCAAHTIPVVIGTTGWEAQLEEAQALSSIIPILYAPNFSLGIALLEQLIATTLATFPDAERCGLEVHHSAKRDAPSGTAKNLDTKFAIPFSSMRYGSNCGMHEIAFETDAEKITLKHEAKNRTTFALGALKVAEWILDKKGWLTLEDYLHSTHYALSS